MTALKKYQRLEYLALWRDGNEQAQVRQVIVALKKKTLEIYDMEGCPLAHWSLGAVQRSECPQRGVMYHCDGEAEETLEFAAGDVDMPMAIDQVLGETPHSAPSKGWVRWLWVCGALLLGVMLWFASADMAHNAPDAHDPQSARGAIAFGGNYKVVPSSFAHSNATGPCGAKRQSPQP